MRVSLCGWVLAERFFLFRELTSLSDSKEVHSFDCEQFLPRLQQFARCDWGSV